MVEINEDTNKEINQISLKIMDPFSLNRKEKILDDFSNNYYVSNSDDDYKKLFNTNLDTTNLIPSLNYFVNKIKNQSSTRLNTKDLLEKIDLHLLNLDLYRSRENDKEAKNLEISNNIEIGLGTLDNNLKNSKLNSKSSSEPNLSEKKIVSTKE